MNQAPPSANDTKEARLLLPWYITGKLSEPEKQKVKNALAHDADLQADYERELQMVGMIRQNASLLELTTVDSTKQRLDKLLKRIDRETATQGTSPQQKQPSLHNQATSASSSWLQHLKTWLNGSWLIPANTVFASLLAIQMGVASWIIYLNNKQETIYTSAAVAENSTQTTNHHSMTLLMDFKDDVTAQKIREFLLKWNAHIIDGPDANNLFRVEIRDAPPADQSSELILQKIRQEQSISNFIGQEF